jgi:hypothetical protein
MPLIGKREVDGTARFVTRIRGDIDQRIALKLFEVGLFRHVVNGAAERDTTI